MFSVGQQHSKTIGVQGLPAFETVVRTKFLADGG